MEEVRCEAVFPGGTSQCSCLRAKPAHPSGHLPTSMRPFVGPVKGSVGCAIVVSNKGQDAGAQLLHGEATEPRKQATHEDREPDLNLVEPGECKRNECDGQGRRERPRVCSSWRDGHFCLCCPGPAGGHTAQRPDAPAFRIDEC